MAKQVKIDIVARDKTKRAIDKSKKGLNGLKTAAIAVSAALATIGAGRAISGLVRVGKEMESLQIRFNLLFGSAEEGAKAFDTLADFASKVPFSLGDIAAASGNLAVVAKDARELNKILEITGNVAGATGLDFVTTASQIQRAFAGGIASADIFREKGVRDMLGFSAGVKVSVKETREAFQSVFSGNGEFANTTKELAKTLEGTLSMINDKFLNFQLAINKSFFAELKRQFGDLDEFLAEREDSIEKFGEAIGQALAKGLTEAAETIDLLRAAVQLADRSIKDVTDGNVGFTDSLLLSIPVLREMALVTGLIKIENQELTEILDNINKDTMPTSIRQSNEFIESLQSQAVALGDVNIAAEALKDTYGTLGKTQDEFFSQRASASREAVKGLKIEEEAENKKKTQQLAVFDQAKKLAAEGAQRSKKMFRLQQALAIGEAIMNTYQGATKALAQGGIFGTVMAALVVATGLAQVANIRAQQPPAMFGGNRQQGTPFLVGENGPELFTPASAGTVTPNNQLSQNMGTNNFNFTINAVDVTGVEELLNNNRSTIVNLINTALNDQGKEALI